MNTKGIAEILIIGFFILITVLIIFLVKPLLKNKGLEESQSLINCIQDVEIEIVNACYQNNLLKIKISNKKSIILGDFFLVVMTYSNGEEEPIPTPYHTYVYPYETKDIFVAFETLPEKIKVIPRIEKQAYLCKNEAPEFKNINSC